MTLATEKLPLIVDQAPVLLEWDVVNKRFNVTESGLTTISYRFEFSGTSSSTSGTAELRLGKTGVASYYLGEIEVLAAATKQVISGSVQVLAASGDNLYFEVSGYSNVATLTLIGSSKSWSQLSLTKL
jgi:hypothetical protein